MSEQADVCAYGVIMYLGAACFWYGGILRPLARWSKTRSATGAIAWPALYLLVLGCQLADLWRRGRAWLSGRVAEMREVCICAAIRMPDGCIVRGQRHSHCIAAAYDMPRYREAWECPSGDDQGFVTSRNRYVTREEGLALQKAAGLPSACPSRGGKYHVRQLFSEDLY